MKKISPKTVIKEVLINLVGLYLAYLFLIQGWKKFDPEGFWAPAFNRWGYPVWFMFLIGFLEVAGALLLLIPKTAFYAGIALATVMIGAFTTRAINGSTPDDLIWIAIFGIAAGSIAWIRFGNRWRRIKSLPPA